MMELRDGPAQGTFMVKRAPQYLRAVVGPDGKADVLDQPTDTPSPNETIHIYRVIEYRGTVHMRGRGFAGFYVDCTYVHMPEVNGEEMRSRAAWIDWASAQPEAGHFPDALPHASSGEPE